MGLIKRAYRRVKALLTSSAIERDMNDELRVHLDLLVDEYQRAGMSPDEARRAARRRFGSTLQIKERGQDVRGAGLLDDVWRDVKHALRSFRQRPAVSMLAVLVLALGIGGTVAVFSVVDMLLLRDLPYRDADRMVMVWQTRVQGRGEREGASPGAFLDWRERSRVFTELAAADPFSFDYLGGQEPVTLMGALVTEGFFEALGVEPLIGRAFLREEHTQGRADVIVVSYGAWQRLFGGDPSVVGRRVIVEERPHLVVGVLPRSFHPDVLHGSREREIWAPKVLQAFERTNHRNRYWNVVGRLAPGISLERAQAELTTISSQLATEFPRTMTGMVATIEPFRDHLAGRIREPLIALFGAVVLVLLIACANVASLQLARGAGRQREFAIRIAIGAGRWRLVRQMLVESLVLAALACAGGVAMAYAAIALVAAIGPGTVPQLNELAVDGRVLAFSIVVAGGTALLFGLWPAVQLSRPAQSNMRQDSTSVTASVGRRRVGDALVVAEVALALVLLIGAGLFIRSFVTAAHVDPGFVKSNVAALQVFAYGERYRSNEQRRVFFDQALERIRALPGVEQAGLVSAMPLIEANINIEGGFRVEGRPAPPANEQPTTFLTVATGDYFRALRIPLRRGRLFSEADHAKGAPVVIINDLMAQRFWPNDDPVDHRITANWQGQWRTMQVVGVVGRMRHDGLDQDARPEIFMPFSQVPFGSMTFVVRSSGDPGAVIPAVKARIWAIDPTLPFYETVTVDALVSQSLAPRRFMMQLLGALAGLAFVLAAAGIYAVLSFSTAQRTREMGVRIAMGARAGNILRLVVGEGMMLVGGGLILGLIVAIAATRVLAALLYQVSPTDPLTLTLTTLLLAAVAMCACYIPARRATRVDPLVALRSE